MNFETITEQITTDLKKIYERSSLYETFETLDVHTLNIEGLRPFKRGTSLFDKKITRTSSYLDSYDLEKIEKEGQKFILQDDLINEIEDAFKEINKNIIEGRIHNVLLNTYTKLPFEIKLTEDELTIRFPMKSTVE